MRSMTPVAGVNGCTGRRTGTKNGGVLATNRSWSRNQTLRVTVGKAARMSITTRLGLPRVETVNGCRRASPMPYVVTASKSPARTTVITFGSAKATRPGAVDLPAASCACAGSRRTLRMACPAMRTGCPDASPTRLLTYDTWRLAGRPPRKSKTTRSYPGWCAARIPTSVGVVAGAATATATVGTAQAAASRARARRRTTLMAHGGTSLAAAGCGTASIPSYRASGQCPRSPAARRSRCPVATLPAAQARSSATEFPPSTTMHCPVT